MPKGDLDVTINYIKLAQDVKAAIHFLQNLSDKLDIAAIEQGVKERERRSVDGCRRRKEDNET